MKKQSLHIPSTEDRMEFGPIISYSMLHDPIHASFVLSRYAFISRMLKGKKQVLEIGCGDGFATPLVAASVEQLTAFEIDTRYVQNNTKRMKKINNIHFEYFNICMSKPKKTFDAIYSVDVIEHLDPVLTDAFIKNAVDALHSDGIYIVGTPNITAQVYASAQSRIQHINLFGHQRLTKALEKYFQNVFLFSMNDEVVHLGDPNLAHYLFAIGVGRKGTQ